MESLAIISYNTLGIYIFKKNNKGLKIMGTESIESSFLSIFALYNVLLFSIYE